MPNSILPGYETVLGNKTGIVFDHTGPVSYSQTTGDVINASDLNKGGFDFMDADMTDSTGTYYAWVVPTGGGSGNAIPSVKILWYVLATGAQVANGVNLSAFSLRFFAWCV